MKKLTILVALILCVTIGGVYATWTYAGAEVTSSHKHMSVNIASLGNATPLGEIVNVLNSMDVLLDDGGSYVVKAVFSGKMGFVFMPGPGAPQTVRDNGIELEFDVSQDTPYQYNGSDIFSIVKSEKTSLGKGTKITDANKTTLCAGVDLSSYNGVNYVGGFYVEVNAAKIDTAVAIDDYVDINGTIVLDELAEYNAMKSALTSGTLGVTVYEK